MPCSAGASPTSRRRAPPGACCTRTRTCSQTYQGSGVYSGGAATIGGAAAFPGAAAGDTSTAWHRTAARNQLATKGHPPPTRRARGYHRQPNNQRGEPAACSPGLAWVGWLGPASWWCCSGGGGPAAVLAKWASERARSTLAALVRRRKGTAIQSPAQSSDRQTEVGRPDTRDKLYESCNFN